MPNFLGRRQKSGVIDPQNKIAAGNYTVTFQPSDFQIRVPIFEIRKIAISGPGGSSMRMYVDTTFIDATVRADLNSWDPAQPLPIMPGQTLYFYWSTGTGTIPNVTVDCYAEGWL